MPAPAPFGGASPRSGRPQPGPLRRGQRRSSPGRLCPAPGPQPRSHGNQAGPRRTLARPPAGACARSHVSRGFRLGDRSCRRTFRVAAAEEEKSVPGGAYTERARGGRQSSSSPARQVRCLSPAMCDVLRKPKSVKLRALHSASKFGVAARSCQELLHKGCVRFQFPVSGSRLCLYEDGTEVTDDYFPSLPNDAELLLLTAGQTWQGYVSDITRFLSVFNEPHAGVIRAARQLLSDEQAPQRQKLLADLLHHVSQNVTAETREQDPSWFEGLESRFRNKSGYLRYSCESRIRGYLRELCPQ